MKKLSVAAILVSLMSVVPANHSDARAASLGGAAATGALGGDEVSQQSQINNILAAALAAANSGDEALTASLLAAAISNNPSLATQLVQAFQSSVGNQIGGNPNFASNVLNQVASGLSGNISLQAAVLSAYTPAGGGDGGGFGGDEGFGGFGNYGTGANLAGSFPGGVSGGGSSAGFYENPNQSSAN